MATEFDEEQELARMLAEKRRRRAEIDEGLAQANSAGSLNLGQRIGLGVSAGLTGQNFGELLDRAQRPHKERIQALKTEGSGIDDDLFKIYESRQQHKQKIKLSELERRQKLQDEMHMARFKNSLEGPTKRNDKVLDATTGLRKEFMALEPIKDFQKIDTAYSNIMKAAKDPSAAGDLSLVFSYMKLLDPGSTVREGEFANAQNAAGIPERIRNAYNKSLSGEFLGAEQRADFVNQAQRLYETSSSNLDSYKNQYTELANRYGVDPAGVTSIPSLANQGLSSEQRKQQKLQRLQALEEKLKAAGQQK